MPVTVEQVPAWGIARGKIGHVVMTGEVHDDGWGWARTVCGTVFSWLTKSADQPARICRECRRGLKTCSLTPNDR